MRVFCSKCGSPYNTDGLCPVCDVVKVTYDSVDNQDDYFDRDDDSDQDDYDDFYDRSLYNKRSYSNHSGYFGDRRDYIGSLGDSFYEWFGRFVRNSGIYEKIALGGLLVILLAEFVSMFKEIYSISYVMMIIGYLCVGAFVGASFAKPQPMRTVYLLVGAGAFSLHINYLFSGKNTPNGFSSVIVVALLAYFASGEEDHKWRIIFLVAGGIALLASPLTMLFNSIMAIAVINTLAYCGAILVAALGVVRSYRSGND